MADKDFKVKQGLDVGVPVPITEGGTGQTTAANALNALLPVQTSSNGYFLQTNETNAQWTQVFYQLVQNNGVSVNPRNKLNIVGATFSDDSVNNVTNVTISSGGGDPFPQVFMMGL